MALNSTIEDQPKGPSHLDVLQTTLHQRNGSGYSNNYSLLDIYDGESDEDKETDKLGVSANNDLELGITVSSTSIVKPDDKQTIIRKKSLVDDLSNQLQLNANRDSYIKPINAKTIPEVLKSDYDIYGFKKVSLHQSISNKQYNEWFSTYSDYVIGRKKKWAMLLKSNGLQLKSDDSIPSRFPPKSDKVKKLIRRGIPAEWRGTAWFFYAGGYEKLNKNIGVYDKIVRDTIDITNKDTEVIERDLNRTFPDNIYFNDSITKCSTDKSPQLNQNKADTPMIKSLRRVLVAFAHYQPQIGYCQSLNFLAGLLLLFMSEERAFWMLVILTERIIPKVHSQNLEGVHTDQGVLMLCIKEYIPLLWSILGKTFEGEVLSEDKILTKLPPVTLVTSSWFMSLFVGILPIESVLRIWDIMWYEGSKTVFRFSLTLCKTCLDSQEFQSAKLNNRNTELEQIELFQFMQSYPKTLIDPNLLVDNCFKKIGGYGYGSLSQDEINKCRAFVSKQRQKIKNKKNSIIGPEMNEQERKLLQGDEDIHDVYGFHRSIMSGVAWNNNISNKMKKRFSRKASKASIN